MAHRDEATIAVLLELVPGFVLQTFGLGHIYRGRVGMGLFIMLSYWALQAVNVLLMTLLIGFVTAPLTWLFYLVAAPTNVLAESGNRLITAR